MGKRWVLYLTAVGVSTGVYFACQQWLGWLLLIYVLCLPVWALLVSLPAMLKLRLREKYPAAVPVGTLQTVCFTANCPLPTPPFRYRLRVIRTVTGEEWVLREGEAFPTGHCGKLVCKLEKARVYDYLGLFWLNIHRKTEKPLLVRPVPMPMQKLPDLERYAASAWRPKSGGGFSENHELRQYVPGDKLNQVHWKLTAKTGKYIVREPMEPQRCRVLVEMELRGTPEQLDRMFGRMLWLSDYLLQKGIKHELRALTGNGVQCCPVEDAAGLETAMAHLLGQSMAPPGSELEPAAAAWCCRIGGEEDEA